MANPQQPLQDKGGSNAMTRKLVGILRGMGPFTSAKFVNIKRTFLRGRSGGNCSSFVGGLETTEKGWSRDVHQSVHEIPLLLAILLK